MVKDGLPGVFDFIVIVLFSVGDGQSAVDVKPCFYLV